MTTIETQKIRELNDAFRAETTAMSGAWFGSLQLIVTRGVQGRGIPFVTRALAAVHAFCDFAPENDPYGEHDFGAFTLEGARLYWKIDYYDPSYDHGSDDPSDGDKTRRVLTILLAEEY